MSNRERRPITASEGQARLLAWITKNPPPPGALVVLDCKHAPDCPFLAGGVCDCDAEYSYRAAPADPDAN